MSIKLLPSFTRCLLSKPACADLDNRFYKKQKFKSIILFLRKSPVGLTIIIIVNPTGDYRKNKMMDLNLWFLF